MLSFVDLDKYKHDLSLLDWTDVLCCFDIDVAVEVLTAKLISVLNCHAPWVVFQERKKFKPWITEETKKLIQQRDSLKSKANTLANNSQNNHVVWSQDLGLFELVELG